MLFYKICSNTILFFTSLCLIPFISVGCTSINTCCKTGSGSAILCPPTAEDIVGVRAASDAFLFGTERNVRWKYHVNV